MKCEHYECRCARATELMMMSDLPGQAHLAMEAVEVHFQQVTCRKEGQNDTAQTSWPTEETDACML